MTSGNGNVSGRRWLLLGLILSVLFNVGFASAFVVRLVGFPPPPPPPPPAGASPGIPDPGLDVGAEPPGGPVRMKERLGLTDEQARVFHEDRKAMAAKIRELRARAKEEKAQLFQLVATDGADIVALEQRTARIAALQKEVQDIVVRYLLQMRGKLDSAQKKKFDEFVATDLCGCPMCDGGCLGGRMEPGRHGRHRGGPEGECAPGGARGPGGAGGEGEAGGTGVPGVPGGHGGCGGGSQGTSGGESAPGGCAGPAAGECGCGGTLGGVTED